MTIHSSPTFAAEFLESDPTEWSKLLIDAAAHHVDSTVTSFKTHRWRYAEPQRTLDSGAIILDDGAPVVLAGEVFAGAKVEGAHASGRAGANSLLEVL
ncbi:MAG: hypothetical protein HKN07_09870 [Acidimicrobiia bacterium]|nr:hypothetical protein [Acidimicrobiia bacterium]